MTEGYTFKFRGKRVITYYDKVNRQVTYVTDKYPHGRTYDIKIVQAAPLTVLLKVT